MFATRSLCAGMQKGRDMANHLFTTFEGTEEDGDLVAETDLPFMD